MGRAVEFERSQDCLGGNMEAIDRTACEPYYTALLKLPCGPFTFERGSSRKLGKGGREP